MTSTASEILISADSHVSEPTDLWTSRVPARFRAAAPRPEPFRAPTGEGRFETKPGGWDPNDPALQEACFRAYNDWLIEYCAVAPDRLVGVGCISVYDIDHAVQELERCKDNGLRGALIWQAPHPDLSFGTDHYERFWAAAQELGMPINLHILTGHNYSKTTFGARPTESAPRTTEGPRNAVNSKTFDAVNALYDLIWCGILDRYPRLKFAIVENEVGWIPFFLQQWDYYFRRFQGRNPFLIDKLPSEYFGNQVYATFFDDSVGGHSFSWWGVDNCMWSNDYPHPNSTWPNSREVIARDLGHLPEADRRKLVCDNAARLYGLKVPALV